MKFHRVEPDENYDCLKLQSEGGLWELGLRSMMYGVRVRLGRTGEFYVSLDYCAGADLAFQLDLLNAIHMILQEVPESVGDVTLEGMFPHYTIKPISLCPECWPTLQKMRDDARARLGIEEFLELAA